MRNGRTGSVEQTLARLGIEEVTERLEMSPLLASDVVPEDPDDCDCCCRCVCKYVPIDMPGSAW
jgi:hypothetical protein